MQLALGSNKRQEGKVERIRKTQTKRLATNSGEVSNWRKFIWVMKIKSRIPKRPLRLPFFVHCTIRYRYPNNQALTRDKICLGTNLGSQSIIH
jgi:hypothetical protein